MRRERPVRSERGPKGDAPPIRKVEVESLSRVTQQCARCMTPRMANALVTYEHFHRGQWKRARRMRCARHASKFAKKHRG